MRVEESKTRGAGEKKWVRISQVGVPTYGQGKKEGK